MKPLAGTIHVRLLDAAEQTPGGIILPEQCRKNETHAVVLAVGEGRPIGDGLTSVMWTEVGFEVIFPLHAFRPLTDYSREGIVDERDLLALVTPHGEIEPLNDWVAVEVDHPETTCGSVALPEDCQTVPTQGTIVAFGPGALEQRPSKPTFGTRRPVWTIMGLEDASDLIGARSIWTENTGVYVAGAFTFIRAEDIVGISQVSSEWSGQ